jgi:predicted NUDIX family NTP pyrophosphohydrolase
MAALKKTSKKSTLSAGILAYRKGTRGLQVLLVHPGGPNFPEVDRAEWFDIEFARTKMLSGQMELLDRLLAIAGESAGK